MVPPPNLDDLVAVVREDSPSDAPLDLLATAARTNQQLTETGDALVDHFVGACRQAGLSWSEISAVLGVTKQAAHKRFALGSPTLERFTPRARAVLETAAVASRASGAARVEPQHLLLGLYDQPDGVAAQVLVELGANAEEAVARVMALSGVAAATAPQATQDQPAVAPVPFGPDARSVLRGALDEALALGHNYIGTEHLLLALYRDPTTVAARALGELGAEREAVEAVVNQRLQGFFKRGRRVIGPATPRRRAPAAEAAGRHSGRPDG